MINSQVSRRAAAVVALAAAVVALPACGSTDASSGAGAASATTRAAAAAHEVCPNVGSNAAALMLDGRVDGDLVFRASGVNCAEWSQTGNPTTYSGSAFGAWKQVVRWGLQPARGATPTFIASFTTDPGGQAVASLQVRLGQIKQSQGAHNWQPAYIETRLDYGGQWKRNGSYPIGTVNGRKVRVVTGVVLNPNDGTWDSPNGSGKAQRAWFMRFQYIN